MIVLFTSNTDGGIVQFTVQLLESLINIGEEALAFLPEGTKYTLHNKFLPYIRNFPKTKSLNTKNKSTLDTVRQINKYNPEMVIFTDDEVISSQVLLNLPNSIKTVLCIHDVKPHFSYSTLRKYLVGKLKTRLKKAAMRKCNHILLLSQNSRSMFDREYNGVWNNKVLLLPLGAHVPYAEAEPPAEIQANISHYYLFFGRIDKYKGIYRLIEAYNTLSMANKPKLVIAGNGVLTPEEELLINSNKDIILIKRFIKDEEMIYLYRNSLAVVLPYIEASQSGVLAMAYYFDAPVVVTNLPGLTEFVEHGKTGYVCDSIEDMSLALRNLCNTEIAAAMKVNIKKYYEDNLLWDQNMQKLLDKINEGSSHVKNA